MRSSAIAGVLVVFGLTLVSTCRVEFPSGRTDRVVPRVQRALARREDGTLAGIVVENGRLLEARLSLRDGRTLLTPPRWGIPVTGNSGDVDEGVASFLDRLAARDEDGHPASVVEIELSVDPAVPRNVQTAFLRFLTRRGIRTVPWSDP